MTLLEINKAVIDQIALNLKGQFSNVPIMAEDLAEPIKRPSLKVMIEDPSISKCTGSCTERNLVVRLFYFASTREKNKLENVSMQEVIEKAYVNGLEISNQIIPIESIDSTITDGVLISSFDLQIFEEILEDQGSGEFMEELDITINEG